MYVLALETYGFHSMIPDSIDSFWGGKFQSGKRDIVAVQDATNLLAARRSEFLNFGADE